MDWEWLEGLGIILLIWLGHRYIHNSLKESEEKIIQTVINVGLALGVTGEEVREILEKNKEE